MAYAMHLELLERRAATAQIVAAIALSAGAKDVDMPDLEQMRADFDDELEAEPKMVRVDELELRRRLRVN